MYSFRIASLICSSLIIPAVAILSVPSCSNQRVPEPDKKSLIIEMKKVLSENILESWYPSSVDSVYGGFLADFNAEWKPEGDQNKMIVTQARHVWTTSQVFLMNGDSAYLDLAEHGYDFLKNKMWDTLQGGFYYMLSRNGDQLTNSREPQKTAYGNAFAIYALASYYKASARQEALDLAKAGFFWLEKYSYDSLYSGYFNFLLNNGELYKESNSNFRGIDLSQRQWKDYNTSIHLMEAFTELYKVWPDSMLRKRTAEMFFLIRDTLTDAKGYLNLYFTRDWQRISYRDSSSVCRMTNFYFDHISFGHDIETAYLLLETSSVLRIGLEDKTLAVVKKLVDHSVSKGWDSRYGGLYDAGYYLKDAEDIRIVNKSKIWWSQAEALNALLMMSRIYPDESYYKLFLEQWNYIDKYLIDHQNGEWYPEGLDRKPRAKKFPKATIWKINYHNSRALMNCIRMLKEDNQ
jgi:cellobiose epimerase